MLSDEERAAFNAVVIGMSDEDFERDPLAAMEQLFAAGIKFAQTWRAEERAWLVELQDNGKLRGWLSGDDSVGFGWSPDPNLAIRFCRKQDADWFRERFGFTSQAESGRHLSTEHAWLPLPPAEAR